MTPVCLFDVFPLVFRPLHRELLCECTWVPVRIRLVGMLRTCGVTVRTLSTWVRVSVGLTAPGVVHLVTMS